MIRDGGWSLRLLALACVLLGARARAQAASAAVEVKLHDVPITVTASSALPDPKNPGRYGPANLLDDDPNTLWAEGANSTGAGEWVEYRFPPGTSIYAFLVTPGNPKSSKLYQANARPRKAKLELTLAEGRKLDYELEFPKAFPAGGAIYVGYHREWAIEAARLTVLTVWPGSKYRDLCLATFVPVFQEGERTFRGQGKELAPTLAAFMRNPRAVSEFLPDPRSGKSAWLRAYSQVPSNGRLPKPQLEVDLLNSDHSEWNYYLTPLAGDVAGARSQSDLFRFCPEGAGVGYVLEPLGPPKKPDAFSNFRVRWQLVDGAWKLGGLDLKFKEESPD
jgi:hypothetical protein